ncbi:HD-GYP domain-containing protein [Butyrivibrio sp. YAB3001]|uniref:HD-GYP domain-containing protein n=1 Tax=Butyrivibrio sp. YAB3001 TaxID=1520812 RepID=UPI0008F68F20|nr:HD domain-containing phosphohydrolase [Butyrivibrio sp. YAB3001]SFC36359.1 HDIG domain-containing protein [Butyrivibrio sp. YAB3001]
MKLVSVDKLEPGLVVSENIYTIDDRLVLPKGTVLDDKDIARIKAHSLYNIFVEDYKRNPPPKDEKPKEELSYLEKLKRSEQFIKFKEHIEENAEKLEESFRMIANGTMQLDIEKLTDPVYHLFVEGGGTAGIFDMLHNLRDNSDAVYMHSLNVSLISNTIATWMRLPEEQVQLATAGGLIHDIGKLMVPQNLLNKKTPLNPQEQMILREHVKKGYELVLHKDIDSHIKNCVLMHHELRDGSGYPLGLKTQQIDDIASIVVVANIYDEMTSKRSSREAICPFTVIEMFEEVGIEKFDPNVIMTFLSNIVNTFIANRVMLSTGQVGDIIFINPTHLSKPVVKCGTEYIDLQAKKGISIISLV